MTAARGELMSERQLADLNSQLILAQADAASATSRYEQYKAIVESGEENAVNNATISPKEGGSAVIDGLKSRYLTITKREQEIASRFGAEHPQAVDLRREQADVAHQIFQELSQLTVELPQRSRGRPLARAIVARQHHQRHRQVLAIERRPGSAA